MTTMVLRFTSFPRFNGWKVADVWSQRAQATLNQQAREQVNRYEIQARSASE